ncbi:MAG TPA: DNA mismatch repair protein MutT [Prevotella sp.]|nr:DNA mismatch repair protein MutT [Prevotella sp.]
MHLLEKFSYCPKCGSSHFITESDKSKKCENCGFEYFLNPSAAVAAFIFNKNGELLVEKRKKDPAKGMLDLPGGFCDAQETAEEAIAREVMEETSLKINNARYLFSQPNVYRYSGFDIPTMDLFFSCEVEDITTLKANDDADECFWVKPEDIHTEQFGLRSVRQALHIFKENFKNH